MSLNISESILRQAIVDHKSSNQLSRELGCCSPTIRYHARKYGIKFSAFKNRGNLPAFQTITTPDIAYILGFLWADGWIGDQTVCISLTESDAPHLLKILQRHCTVNVYKRHRKTTEFNRKPQQDLHISDALLARFLLSLDYKYKSHIAPTKVLAHIPKLYHSAFWLGYYDGDGHYSYPDYQLSFASTLEQDWGELIILCDKLEVAWRIRKYINPYTNHRFSSFTVPRKAEVRPFLIYLYQYFDLGLPRKRIKYAQTMTAPCYSTYADLRRVRRLEEKKAVSLASHQTVESTPALSAK